MAFWYVLISSLIRAYCVCAFACSFFSFYLFTQPFFKCSTFSHIFADCCIASSINIQNTYFCALRCSCYACICIDAKYLLNETSEIEYENHNHRNEKSSLNICYSLPNKRKNELKRKVSNVEKQNTTANVIHIA